MNVCLKKGTIFAEKLTFLNGRLNRLASTWIIIEKIIHQSKWIRVLIFEIFFARIRKQYKGKWINYSLKRREFNIYQQLKRILCTNTVGIISRN